METKNFEQLNLSAKETLVYLANLELGPSTVQRIAKKAGLPRSSTYLLIEELKEKGLVSQSKAGKKTTFIPSPPAKLVQLAEEQEEKSQKVVREVRSLLPQLKALHQKTPTKPSVRFYEGFEGIKTIFEETLAANQILVLCSGYEKLMEKKLEQYMSSYFHKVLAGKIPTFEIIGGCPGAKEYQKECSSAINKIKLVPHAKDCPHIDKVIFGNKMAIISFAYLNGVVIENKAITDYEKALFWRLWNTSEAKSD